MTNTQPKPHRALPISIGKLIWRIARSDWRGPQLRLLWWSVVWAVAAVTAVAFLVNRVDLALARDAQALLGGEVVVSSSRPLPAAIHEQAQDLGLMQVETTSFVSMARTAGPQEASKLVDIKAVGNGYPLRGSVQLSPPQPSASATPPLGKAWVSPSLLNALGLSIGDALLLGQSRFDIAASIQTEPDSGFGFTQFLPRVILNADDVAATGLVQPASRVKYRLYLAGPDVDSAQSEAAQEFQAWFAQRGNTADAPGIELESLDRNRPEVDLTMGRAQSFLGLLTLLTVFFCATAIALSARLFALQRLDSFALLRVLGLTRKQIASAYFGLFFALALGASILGALGGGFAHFALIALLQDFLPVSLPSPSFLPWLLGLGVGLSLVLSFGMAPLLRATHIPPLHVLRQQEMGPIRKAAPAWALGLTGLTLLVWWYSQSWLLGLSILGGCILAIGCIAAIIWGVLALIGLLQQHPFFGRKTAAGMALQTLTGKRRSTIVQTSALTLSLMVLGLLFLLRTDLLDHWRDASLGEAPNYFAINVLPEQLDPFEAALAQVNVRPGYDLYPMVRGRLLRINQEPVSAAKYPESARAQRLVQREFNLSFSPTLPLNNQLASGQWQAEQTSGISIEQGLAQELGLELGDSLVFDLAGVERESRITSIRQVDWGSLRANFFALYPVSSLPNTAYTYLLAFYVPSGNQAEQALAQQFPNVSLINVSAVIGQLQTILNQVTQVVELLFAFTLGAGLLVLVGTLHTSAKERTRELAIFRALGANRQQLRTMLRYELLMVGALAGLLAGIMTSALGSVLVYWVLDLDSYFSFWPILISPVVGALLVYGTGWRTLSPLLQQPLVPYLRTSEAIT